MNHGKVRAAASTYPRSSSRARKSVKRYAPALRASGVIAVQVLVGFSRLGTWISSSRRPGGCPADADFTAQQSSECQPLLNCTSSAEPDASPRDGDQAIALPLGSFSGYPTAFDLRVVLTFVVHHWRIDVVHIQPIVPEPRDGLIHLSHHARLMLEKMSGRLARDHIPLGSVVRELHAAERVAGRQPVAWNELPAWIPSLQHDHIEVKLLVLEQLQHRGETPAGIERRPRTLPSWTLRSERIDASPRVVTANWQWSLRVWDRVQDARGASDRLVRSVPG